MTKLGIALVLFALGVAPAAAQDEQPAPPAAPAAPVSEGLGDSLAGPEVPRSARATIVSHEYEGSVRRVEEGPELAALAQLDLDAAVRAKIDSLLATRAAILDEIILDNLNLLGQIDTATNAGDRLDQFLLTVRFLYRLSPHFRQDSLRSEIIGALPEEHAAEFSRLLTEYRDALIAERRAKEPRTPRVLLGVAVDLEQWGQRLTRDIEASVDRTVGRIERDFEDLIRRLRLDAESEDKLRRLYQGGDDEKTKGLLFLQVLAHLDEARRQELLEFVAQVVQMTDR